MFADLLVTNSEFVAPGDSPRLSPPHRPCPPPAFLEVGTEEPPEGSDALSPAGEAAGGGCAGVGARGLVRGVGCEGDEQQKWVAGTRAPVRER